MSLSMQYVPVMMTEVISADPHTEGGGKCIHGAGRQPGVKAASGLRAGPVIGPPGHPDLRNVADCGRLFCEWLCPEL
jgi:hypothetical protein